MDLLYAPPIREEYIPLTQSRVQLPLRKLPHLPQIKVTEGQRARDEMQCLKRIENAYADPLVQP